MKSWKKSLIRWNRLYWAFVYLCGYCLIVHEIELLNKRIILSNLKTENDKNAGKKNVFLKYNSKL